MNRRLLAVIALSFGMVTGSVHAAFHFIEIEQVIGGLNGDPNAQAVQLRLRSGSQNQFTSNPIRIVARNATGGSPVVIGTITSNFGTGTSGSRILFTTAAFDTAMAGVSGFDSDFTLSLIPETYLAGGKITFETLSGSTIYWSLAFGSYTGSNTGNSANGTFGTAFASALPTDSRGLLYQNGTNASTNNATDYALTAGPATVRNGTGGIFVVVPEPGTIGLLAFGGLALSGLVWSRRRGKRYLGIARRSSAVRSSGVH